MKEQLTCVLPLAAYCIPFAYFGMWGDAEKDTIVFHIIWVLGLFYVCKWFREKWGRLSVLLAGNAVSLLVSCVFVFLFATEEWSWYFKPLSALGMACVGTLAVTAVQVIWWFYRDLKEKQ